MLALESHRARLLRGDEMPTDNTDGLQSSIAKSHHVADLTALVLNGYQLLAEMLVHRRNLFFKFIQQRQAAAYDFLMGASHG